MKREEILEKLHNISVGTVLTALTEEGALECEYVTAEGKRYEWIGFEDWPAFKLCNISKEKIVQIRSKLKIQSLTVSDLQGTDLLDLFECCFSSEDDDVTELVNVFFSDIASIAPPENGVLFAICYTTCYEPTASFYSDYASFEKAFEEECACVDIRWEDLSDEELQYWLDRTENEFNGISFTEFTHSDETDNYHGC